MYWRGDGVQQDNNMAIRWFSRGVELNDPNSLIGLGLMLLKGDGIEKDVDKGFRYLKKAADLENSDAQTHMGLFLLKKRDYAAATKYFSQAVQKGHILAMYHLAEMYRSGVGGEQNCEMASLLFKIVTEKGLEWIDPLFTEAYRSLANGNPDLALLLYVMAAEKGFEVAQSNVAWMIDSAQIYNSSVHPNLNQLALINWNRAANQGVVEARLKMGDYYFYGIGVPVNFEKAASYYQIAADEKSSMALWNLAWMHENGFGVAKDYHLSKRFYERVLEKLPEAWLPVTLSLFKLKTRNFYEFARSLLISEAPPRPLSATPAKPQPPVKVESDTGQNAIKEDEFPQLSDPAEEDDDWDWNQLKRPTRKKQGWFRQIFADDSDEETTESFIILGLCLIVGYLVYMRQLRFGNPRFWNPNQRNNLNNNENNPANNNIPGNN